MDVINSIKLSSGTIVKIPIFPAVHVPVSAVEYQYTKSSRAYAVIMNNRGNIRDYQLYSDKDLIELLNLIYGRDFSSYSVDIGDPVTGNRPALLCWLWMETDQKYVLQTPELKSSTTDDNAVINLGYVWGRGVHGPNFYYDSQSYYNDTWHSYADKCAEIEESAFSDFALNVRPGAPYTLDICVNYGDFGIPGTGSISLTKLATNISKYIEEHPDADIEITGYDPEGNTDPYIITDPAGFDGGNGDREQDPDEIEKATIPPLPSLSAVDTGLITMYGATLAQLQSLGAYLWASWWDIETNFKKLFSDPMNCLIGLSIIPVRPTMGGAQNVKFGNITTNVALNKLSSQWAEVDCGTISIKEYVGSFLDYSPYVNISIYLPYIGYRELSPDDVMNDTIHVVYHIDCLTGGCCAFIECGKKGLLYTFNGSCIANVPITAINYSGAIQNAVSAVGSIAMTAAGMATGAAPVAAAGAISTASKVKGAISIADTAANTAVNTKPTVQRSGNMGGAAGLMSYQKPLLVITRPRMSVPDKLNKFAGLTTNVTMPLSSCVGFTQVQLIHLDNVPCTTQEREELLSLLTGGVIF